MGRSWVTISWHIVGSGEAVERSAVALSTWRETDLVTQQAGVYWKRCLVSPVLPGVLLGPWPKYLRWWEYWAEPLKRGVLPCSILCSLWSSTMNHVAFLLTIPGHGKHGRWGMKYPLGTVFGLVSTISLCSPVSSYWLKITTFQRSGRLTGSQLVLPLSTGFDYSNPEAEFTNKGLQSLTL